MSIADFYRAFEDRHRGARSLITRRLEVYLPFIAPLAQLYSPAAAIDLGCGRGEWLELLIREGFTAQGVDLDEGMLAACRELGLPAIHGNAVERLKTLADASQCVVSGFHFAEHIAFDDLETLVSQSLRVLKPGGLLILETPNPENLVVGTSSFYLDPTHVRPLPPLLLSFLPEHHGFERVKVLRLQEAPDLHEAHKKIELMHVLEGVSPDYSVVAQKAADADVLERFDATFAAPHGLVMHELANRHEAAIEQRIAGVEAAAQATSSALEQNLKLQEQLFSTTESLAQQQVKNLEVAAERLAHTTAIDDLSAQVAALQDQFRRWMSELAEQQARDDERVAKQHAAVEALTSATNQLSANALHLQDRLASTTSDLVQQAARSRELEVNAQQMQQRLASLGAERDALRKSWSWRTTAPLRWGAGLWMDRRPAAPPPDQGAAGVAATAAQRPVVEAMRVVLRNPALAYRINQRVLRYPALHQRLRGMAKRAGMMPDEPADVAPPAPDEMPDLSNLTPHAREIYSRLERAFLEHKTGPV